MKKILQLFFASTVITTIYAMQCDDAETYKLKCPHWATNGECTKSSGFMKIFCKKSCGECPGKYLNSNLKNKIPNSGKIGGIHPNSDSYLD